METADVVIVGAGVIGASVAWHLARRGVRRVVLLERDEAPGRGSTGRATGGFRAQFATDINVRLSLLARDALRAFPDDTGVDPGYRPVGYLWVATSEPALDALRAAHSVQREVGLGEARLVGRDDVRALQPAVADEGVLGGAWCPTDGTIRPTEILRGYLEGALAAGARLRTAAAVVEVLRDAGGRVAGVRATDGTTCATRTVVNAAGAWAAALAALAGVDLPVTPLRRQVAPTVPCDVLPVDAPMTLWVDDGFHLRVRDGRVLLLLPTPGRPGAPFDTSVDPAWLDRIAAVASARVPPLAGVPLDRGAAWGGLYEQSPDGHAILGEAPGCPGLVLVNGSSGHGVMHAPALGRLAAELILDGVARSLDASPLAPTRFAEGRTLPYDGWL